MNIRLLVKYLLFRINMLNKLKTIANFISIKYTPQHSGSQEMEPNSIDNANFLRSKSGITSEIMKIGTTFEKCYKCGNI